MGFDSLVIRCCNRSERIGRVSVLKRVESDYVNAKLRGRLIDHSHRPHTHTHCDGMAVQQPATRSSLETIARSSSTDPVEHPCPMSNQYDSVHRLRFSSNLDSLTDSVFELHSGILDLNRLSGHCMPCLRWFLLFIYFFVSGYVYWIKLTRHVSIVDLVKSVEFWSECGRAKCFSPRVLSRMS